MDSIKEISDNIASKGIQLTMFYLRLMKVDEKSSVAYAINNEVVAATFAMDKLFTRGEYDYSPVLEYYSKLAKRDAAFISDMKSQIEFYLNVNRKKEDIAKELTERIVYIQFNRKNAAWGKECPVTPLDLDVFSPNFPVQYTLTDKGEETVLKYLDFKYHFNHLPEPESKKVVSEKGKEGSGEDEELPLTFHKFWINAVLPLSILGYIIYIISNFITLGYAVLVSLIMIGFNVFFLVLAIQAVIGLRTFERKAYVAHKRLLVSTMVFDGIGCIILLIAEPISALIRIAGIVINVLVFMYYRKREHLFVN